VPCPRMVGVLPGMRGSRAGTFSVAPVPDRGALPHVAAAPAACNRGVPRGVCGPTSVPSFRLIRPVRHSRRCSPFLPAMSPEVER